MKPHQYPIEFANLTQDQLNQIHAWLDEHSYKVAVQKLQSELNIHITISKLARYNQRRELADDLTAESDYQLSVKELYDALNGAEAPYDKTAELLISKRIFQILLSADPIAPSKLALLHRLLTSRETRDFTERRLALATADSSVPLNHASLRAALILTGHFFDSTGSSLHGFAQNCERKGCIVPRHGAIAPRG